MKLSMFLVSLAFLAGVLSAQAGEDPSVATVGSQEITLSQLEQWIDFNPDAARDAMAGDPKQKAAFLRQVVTSMVVADIAREKGFDRRSDLQQKQKLLLDNFVTVEYLDKEVASKVEVAEKDALRHYEDHPGEFGTPEQVRARHILVRSSRTAPQDERRQAEAKAEDLLKQVQQGGDFSQLAAEHSDDPGSRRRGGDLGPVPRGVMAPEFEQAAFALQPGEVSGLVQTNFGYHIIRVEEKTPASVQPFDEVREQLIKRLTIEKKREAVDAFVREATERAGVTFEFEPLFGPGGDPHAQ